MARKICYWEKPLSIFQEDRVPARNTVGKDDFGEKFLIKVMEGAQGSEFLKSRVPLNDGNGNRLTADQIPKLTRIGIRA
jgi:hypothetical protein